MASYSVATTKDQLSRLIDKALAGEEVVITRHGKPTVELRVVQPAPSPPRTNAEWMEHFAKLRAQNPPLSIDSAQLVREMRDEGAH